MVEIGRAIRSQLGDAARKVPKRNLTDWVVKLVALFDPTARQVVPELGRQVPVDDTRTREALQMTYIPATDAAVAMARSLIELNVV